VRGRDETYPAGPDAVEIIEAGMVAAMLYAMPPVNPGDAARTESTALAAIMMPRRIKAWARICRLRRSALLASSSNCA